MVCICQTQVIGMKYDCKQLNEDISRVRQQCMMPSKDYRIPFRCSNVLPAASGCSSLLQSAVILSRWHTTPAQISNYCCAPALVLEYVPGDQLRGLAVYVNWRSTAFSTGHVDDFAREGLFESTG